MTNQNFEQTGLEVVLRGVQKFASDIRKSTNENEALARSHLRLQQITEQAAAKRIAAEAAVARTKASLTSVQETANLKLGAAETRLAAAKQAVANSSTLSTAKQLAASKELLAAETALNLERVRQQGLVAKATIAANTAIIQQQQVLRVAALNQQVALAGITGAAAQTRLGVGALANAIGTPFRLAIRGAGVVTKRLGEALIAVTGFANRFAVSLRFGIAALAAFSAAFTIRTAAQYEEQLAKIDNLTNASAKDIETLDKGVRKIAANSPKSPNELGAGAYLALSSGIQDVNEALAVTDKAQKAATIGLGTTDEVVKVLTAVINAYGKENISASQATDVLVAAIREGSAEAPEFAQGLGRLLGIAPQLGIEFDQLVASIAALTNVGLPANQAITAILGILNQLIDPSTQAKEAFQLFGTSTEEVLKNISEKGLTTGLQDLITLFKGNREAIADVFPEVRGLTGFLGLFAREGNQVDNILKNIQNSAGITDAAFERLSETTSFQFGVLKNQLNLALIELGSKILPSVTEFLDKQVQAWKNNKDGIIAFAIELGKLVSVLVGGFIAGLKAVNSAFSFLPKNIVSATIAILAFGIALNTVFGGIPIAIGALITAIGIIVTHWDEVKLSVIEFGITATETLRDLGTVIERFVLGPIGGLLSSVEAVGNAFGLLDFGDLSLSKIGTDIALDELRKERDKIDASLKEQEARRDRDRDNLERERNAIIDAGGGGPIDLTAIQSQLDNTALAAKNATTVAEALEDGIIDFKEAMELSIDAITAGALEATTVFQDSEEAAFDFTKTLSKVANAFKKSEDAAKKLVLALAREALAKIKAAQQELFGAPTREVADLQVKLAQAEEAQAKELERLIPQIEAIQDNIDALKELNDKSKSPTDDPIVAEVIQKGLAQDARGSINKFGKSIDDQIQALEDQKAALERELELGDRKIGAITREIDVLAAHTAVLDAQVTAANNLLLTQKQQEDAAITLKDKMNEASAKTQELANAIGENVLESFNELENAFTLLQGAIGVLEDPEKRSGFLNSLENATNKTDDFANGLVDNLKTIEEHVQDFLKASGPESESSGADLADQISNAIQRALSPGAELGGFQHGGLIRRPTISMLGEGSKPELVLPLTQPNRVRELIRSVPPQLSAGISGGQSSPSSIFGNLNVSGETLETMRLAARAEVDSAFRKKMTSDYHRVGL